MTGRHSELAYVRRLLSRRHTKRVHRKAANIGVAWDFPAIVVSILLCASWLNTEHFLPWRAFHSDALAGLALAVICFSAGYAKEAQAVQIPPVALTCLAIGTIPWLQWMAGLLSYSGDAWISSTYLAGVALAITAGSYTSRDGRAGKSPIVRATLVATILSGICSSIIAVAQAFDVTLFGDWAFRLMSGNRGSANLGQANNAATLIFWACIVLFYAVEKRVTGWATAFSLALVLILGLVATQSRTALFYGPIMIIAVWKQRRHLKLLTNPLWIAVMWIAYLVLMIFWSKLQNIMLLAPTDLIARGTGSMRYAMWPMLLEALTRQPSYGFGWLQVGEAQLLVAEDFPNSKEIWLHAHNMFLDFVLWCGIPVGSLLIALTLYWFFSRWRKITSIESLTCMLLISTLGTHSMLELPHHYAYFLLPAGLWAGIVESEKSSVWNFSTRWLLAAPILILGIFLSILWQYPRMEEGFRVMRFESMKIGVSKDQTVTPQAPLLSNLVEFLWFSQIQAGADVDDTELSRMIAITKRYPYATSLYKTSIALALHKREDDARLMFLKLQAMNSKAVYEKAKLGLAKLAANGDPALRRLLLSAQ